jgi:hypothetical protein
MARQPPPRKYPVTPLEESEERHCLCAICGCWVDELNPDEVLQHLEPEHATPTKN